MLHEDAAADHAWFAAFDAALRARGASPAQAYEAVTRIDASCRQARMSPREFVGDPRRAAMAYHQEVLSPAASGLSNPAPGLTTMRQVWTMAVGAVIILSLVLASMFAAIAAAYAYAVGEDHVTLPLLPVGGISACLLLTVAMTWIMLQVGRAFWLFILLAVALDIAVIVASALVDGPVLITPRAVMAASAAVFTLVLSAALWALESFTVRRKLGYSAALQYAWTYPLMLNMLGAVVTLLDPHGEYFQN